MRISYLAPLVTLLALVTFAGVATAQEEVPSGFERCGDENLVLVFMNPDLMPRDDGYVHASGSFFIQFQARGEAAFDIETFKFSFGPHRADLDVCSTPEWVTGTYLKNYRADNDPNDGFFVNINTCNVPDGEYAAAISAYNKDEKELVRYYTKALVANGPGNNAAERCQNPDTTVPWPMILPGDGERLDGGQGLYIEVAEPISFAEAFLNGKKIALTEGLGPERDDDLLPDLGYHPALRSSDVAQGQVQKVQYPTFTYDGVIRSGDVIRVRLIDQWGNEASKVVHLGDPTIGGRVTGASVQWTLEIPEKRAESDANGTATYNVKYIIENDEPLHADLRVEGKGGTALPDGITYRLDPDHVQTKSGKMTVEGIVKLIATPEVATGQYEIDFVADYLTGSARMEKRETLIFVVTAPPESDFTQSEEYADPSKATEQQNVAGVPVNTTAAEEAPAEEEKSGIPAPTPLAMLAVVGLAALARRRLR